MSHRAAHRFWRLFGELPPEVQQIARENFLLLKQNAQHPSLRLKRVGRYWSVRIGSSFRGLGVDAPDGVVWFWIGPHEEYERIVKRS